ncbi:MAG: zf-HC2 domain-containing protein [Nitrososphaerota archaeon]
MTHPISIPAPTPECAAFETLLPLLDTDALTPGETAATRDHIAGCAWCRSQREGYDTFEAALRRHYSPGAPEPATTFASWPMFRLENSMRDDEAEALPAGNDYSGEEDIFEITSIGPIPSLPDPDRRPRRWRPRLIAEIAAVLVVALLATTLLVAHFGLSSGNQPPLRSAAGAVVFVHSVSWGRLEINGQATPVAMNGASPLYLPRGRNTLTYYAPPLPMFTCTISAPAASDDTCPLYHVTGQGVEMIGPDGQTTVTFGGRVVDLKAVPDRLTTNQRDMLVKAAQQQLDAFRATMTVLPGDHYSTPEGHYLTANRSFTITLKYQVSAESISPSLDICAPFCDTPDNHWNVTPTVSWDYVDQYGKPETVLQGPGGPGELTGSSLDIPLRWSGTWHVVLDNGSVSSALCNLIGNMVINRPENSGGLGVGCSGNPLATYIGTLLQIQGPADTGGTTQSTGHALYRAGALIALDPAARALTPWMPLASAHELAIARQLGFDG